MRLDRFICKSTTFTRQQASALILQQRVRVNGSTDVHEAFQVHESNHITLDEKPLTARASRYLMLHKPAGFVSSNVDGRYPSLFNNIDIADTENLHIAGRLDRDTTGLVLITDDGRWSFNVTSPDTHCEKVYRVTLRNDIEDDAIAQLEQGMQIPGMKSPTRPAKVKVLGPKEVLLTITEGKYHQVKRMFGAVRNKVMTLHRQQIGELSLDLEVGKWRYLTPQEVSLFQPSEET